LPEHFASGDHHHRAGAVFDDDNRPAFHSAKSLFSRCEMLDFTHVKAIRSLERGLQQEQPISSLHEINQRTHRFPVIQPNSGRRDYSRSSCDGGSAARGLVPGSRQRRRRRRSFTLTGVVLAAFTQKFVYGSARWRLTSPYGDRAHGQASCAPGISMKQSMQSAIYCPHTVELAGRVRNTDAVPEVPHPAWSSYPTAHL
jgi:hypothetical protein